MSYILDALKKAERERGIAKVPTLETIHAAAPRSGSARWAAISFILILLAAVTGLYLYSRSGSERNAPAFTEVASQPPPANSEESAPSEAGDPEVPSGFPKTSDASGSIPSSKPLDMTQKPPAPSAALPSGGVVSKAPAGYAPAAPVQKYSNEAAPEKSLSGSTVEEAPMIGETAVPAADAPPGPAPLSEAIQGMQVTIHLYSEVPGNRKIYINGKKYAEGDYVDGTYLVESITPEGAVLSYQGSRAVLKAAD